MTVRGTQTQKVPPLALSSRDERRARFRSFLTFLAKHSDVVLTPKKPSSFSRAMHLTSEDAPVSEESLALTTTSAFLRMFEAWWLEFKLKDSRAGTLHYKLKTLFKGSELVSMFL